MGLSSRTMVRRLRAWHLGEPLTRGQTIHTATAARNDRLLLAFVKMGGETRPWGIAWKSGSKRLEFRFVPEPRQRAAVDEMVAELGPVVAEHLQHPEFVRTEATEPADLTPLRQIWVPNGSHIDMLHHFGYTYARRQKEREHAEELRLLGRTSLYLFLESERPGQQLVASASDALRSAYDFPAEDTRQAHLGFLLAWLSARGDREHGLAAALEAEKQPVATALLPELERRELSKLVESYNEARRDENTKQMSAREKPIGELLRPELERRLALVGEAIEMVETDPRPVNRGVDELVSETLKAQWWGYVKPEAVARAASKDPWVPSPETDFQARGAAARYFRNEASADRMVSALVHDDHELEAEAIAAGRAFRGTVVQVFDESTTKAKTLPVWRIEDPTPGPLSIRHGDTVCVVGHKKRAGTVRGIASTKGGGLVLELLITNIKTAAKNEEWPNSMHAADERWIGQIATVIGTSFAPMTDKKAFKVNSWDALPGDWVVKSPSGERAEASETQAETVDA